MNPSLCQKKKRGNASATRSGFAPPSRSETNGRQEPENLSPCRSSGTRRVAGRSDGGRRSSRRSHAWQPCSRAGRGPDSRAARHRRRRAKPRTHHLIPVSSPSQQGPRLRGDTNPAARARARRHRYRSKASSERVLLRALVVRALSAYPAEPR
jgi:hypothetical protein